MTEIISDISELQSLTNELKRIRQSTKAIRQRKLELESRILTYLESTDQPGVKYKDVILMANNKDTYKRPSTKNKIKKGAEFLERFGLRNSEQVTQQFVEILRGSPKQTTQLKMMKKKTTH